MILEYNVFHGANISIETGSNILSVTAEGSMISLFVLTPNTGGTLVNRIFEVFDSDAEFNQTNRFFIGTVQRGLTASHVFEVI